MADARFFDFFRTFLSFLNFLLEKDNSFCELTVKGGAGNHSFFVFLFFCFWGFVVMFLWLPSIFFFSQFVFFLGGGEVGVPVK